MISVSKKRWTEKKVLSTNVELAASTHNISYNLAKFYLSRRYNAKELKLEKSNEYDFDFIEKSKDFKDGANFLFKIIKKKKKLLFLVIMMWMEFYRWHHLLTYLIKSITHINILFQIDLRMGMDLI